MEGTITIALSEELRSALDEMTQTEGFPADRLINQAIQEYIFFRRFCLLHDRMASKAHTQGICTDQDVFDLVS